MVRVRVYYTGHVQPCSITLREESGLYVEYRKLSPERKKSATDSARPGKGRSLVVWIYQSVQAIATYVKRLPSNEYSPVPARANPRSNFSRRVQRRALFRGATKRRANWPASLSVSYRGHDYANGNISMEHP